MEGFYSTWGGSKQPDLSDYTKCTSRATMTSNQSNKLSSSLEVLNYRRRLMKKSPSTQLKKRGRKPKAGTSAKKQQKCLWDFCLWHNRFVFFRTFYKSKWNITFILGKKLEIRRAFFQVSHQRRELPYINLTSTYCFLALIWAYWANLSDIDER